MMHRGDGAEDEELTRGAERRRDLGDGRELLAEASDLLASSLDAAGLSRGLAALAVERLASWCVIDLRDKDGATEQVCFRHEDAALEPLGAALARRLRPTGEPRRPEVFAGPEAPARLAAALGAAEPEVIARLGAASYLSVPLRAREQTIGAMTLVSARPDRLYGSAELALAVDLGQRAALAVDNARLYEDAREAARIREEFLSIASHELRTPLSALKLQVQSLERQLRRAPGEIDRLMSKIDVAQRQIDRLTRLVNELLDVSRIEMGRLELDREELDLGELVRDVVGRHCGEIERSGSAVELAIAGGVVGEWDRLRLEQVITNLLQNALKYGRARPIRVAVGAIGRVARVEVADEGIGIAASEHSRIFGRFERAVSSRAYGGMGVGLFIVEQILKAHGGTIAVRSEPGVGSIFVVELPLSPESRRELAPRSLGARAAAPR